MPVSQLIKSKTETNQDLLTLDFLICCASFMLSQLQIQLTKITVEPLYYYIEVLRMRNGILVSAGFAPNRVRSHLILRSPPQLSMILHRICRSLIQDSLQTRNKWKLLVLLSMSQKSCHHLNHYTSKSGGERSKRWERTWLGAKPVQFCGTMFFIPVIK